MDPNEFNTALAKELKKLKKAVGATKIRQGYRGTGSKKHSRQIWVDVPWSARGIDLWLEDSYIGLGGVIAPFGQGKRVRYGDKSPQEVYVEVEQFFRDWSQTRENPYGSFAHGGSPAFTAKGRRMEEKIAETSGPGIAAATVYSRAKERPGTGLVKKKWAEEHGYPEPNPGAFNKVVVKRVGHPDEIVMGEYRRRQWLYEDGSPIEVGGAYVEQIVHNPNPTKIGHIEIIPARILVNKFTGRKVSPYGAHPGGEGWELQTEGWTWKDVRTGSIGMGRRPVATEEEAIEMAKKWVRNPIGFELEANAWANAQALAENNNVIGMSYIRPEETRHNQVPLHAIEHGGYSDYSGGTVGKSNFQIIQDMAMSEDELKPFLVFAYGGYGSNQAYIRLDMGEVPEELMRVVGALANYPVLDEHHLSEVEMEEEDEAWTSWAREDWRDALKKEFPDYEDQIDDFSDEELDRLWFEEAGDLSWTVEHTVEGPTFNFDEALTRIELEEV